MQQTIKPDTVKVTKTKKVNKNAEVVAKGVLKPNMKVDLLSYEIEATIPTGPYANIKPRIQVLADSIEAAEAYVIPHINKLFAEFLNRGERVTVSCSAPVTTLGSLPHKPVITSTSPTPKVSASYSKAKKIIDSCDNVDTMELIKKKIDTAVAEGRLTTDERADLLDYIRTK